MGTNYYLKRIPTESEVEQRIHVGKSSYGWKFAFQIGGEECLNMGRLRYARKNAYWIIQQYLNDGYELWDEYGEEITLADFAKLVDSKANEDEHYDDGEIVRDEVVRDGARWVSTWFC